MVDTPTVQIYHNGFRNIVLGLTLVSDGSGLNAFKVYDATSGGAFGVNVGGQVFYPGVHTKIVGLDFDVQDMKFQLLWEATANVPIITYGASPEDFNWRKMGGIYGPQAEPGLTGSILVSTINPMPDSTLTFMLYLRKDIKQ